jgi:hypothetical protein
MADFEYVACPKCHEKFMAGEEFFRLPQAYCHCPYCGNEFPVGVAADGEARRTSSKFKVQGSTLRNDRSRT